MAKKAVAFHDSAHEEELVVTVVRFKGSGETARKGIDAVSQALAAAFGGGATAVVRHVNSKKAAPQLTAPADTIDTEAIDDAEDTDTDAPEETGQAVRRERAAVKPPKPDGTLNVVPFKALAAARNPRTMEEKYLLACFWLQTDSGRDSYGGQQILTCFRTMGWTEYGDFTQPLRTMKKNTTYFVQDVPKRQWKLTENGIDVAGQINNPAGT
jgi:hypothetical protein